MTSRPPAQRYLETIVKILSVFMDEPKTRDKVMRPIWTEEERVRAFRRQRRGGLLDVNPETGELVLPPSEQAEAEAEAPAEQG